MIMAAFLSSARSAGCTPADRAGCVLQYGTGMELDWMCQNCEKRKREEVLAHPYIKKLLNSRLLHLGGYPFGKNDFTAEEWRDLGRIEQCLETPAPSK